MNLGGVRMVDKVILTKEQANAIKRWINKEQLIIAKASGLLEHSMDESIAELTMEQLVKALYIGYEVEPEFKVGDWVVWDDMKIIGQLVEIGIGLRVDAIEYDFPQDISLKFLRHATPEEIAEEKERRFWNKFGREVNEYRA